MQAKELILHNCSHWEVVEHICEVLPDIRIPVLPHTFVIKPIRLCYLLPFMISSENAYPIGIANLQREQKDYDFNPLIASVNIVAHEAIVRVGEFSTDFE